MAKNCGHKVPCGCGDTYLTTPAPCGDGIECNGTECSEIFSTNCIVYTGEDIDCSGTPLATNGQTLNEIIENICTLPNGTSDFPYTGPTVDCGALNLATAGDTFEQILIKICARISSIGTFFNIIQPSNDAGENDNIIIIGDANNLNVGGDLVLWVDRIGCNDDIIITITSIDGITFAGGNTVLNMTSGLSILTSEWRHPTGLPAGSYLVLLTWSSCGINKTQNITFNLI